MWYLNMRKRVLQSTWQCAGLDGRMLQLVKKSYDYLLAYYADPEVPLELDVSVEKGECFLYERPISHYVNEHPIKCVNATSYWTLKRKLMDLGQPADSHCLLSSLSHFPFLVVQFKMPKYLLKNQRLAGGHPVSGKVMTFPHIPIGTIRR